MWYDADELEEFKKSRKATARRMDKGSVLEDDCTRGLEVKTKAGMKHRHYEILGALNAVLDEQDNQEKNGVINHEAIARIYQMYSRQSGVVARERGVSDEEEAR